MRFLILGRLGLGIISSEKWFNYVVTFFSFCLKMPKIWVGRTTLNGAKKEDGLSRNR